MQNKLQNKSLILLILATLAFVAYAQGADSSSPLNIIQWRIEDAVRLVLCALWFVVSAILAALVVLSGLKYMTSEDPEKKDAAKKMVIQGFIAFVIIVIACPTVNYLVHKTDVKEFKCDCLRVPAPTTTTSTTTTTWVYTTVTTVTTTTTTTFVTTTTLYPKSSGGRFLLVGNHKFMDWAGYKADDIYGVIFNMDGSIYKSAFAIGKDKGPVALAVGANRFFVSYGGNAVVLDWEGKTVKAQFSTKSGNIPIKAVHNKGKFYLLLSPYSGGGGCELQVYDLDGALQSTYKVDIDKIEHSGTGPGGFIFPSEIIIPEGDMALGGDKLFIVWYDKAAKNVNGIVYDLDGTKTKPLFTIASSVSASCTHTSSDNYVNPQVETGSTNYVVLFNGRLFPFEIGTMKAGTEKAANKVKCVHDFTYGSGEFLAAEDNQGEFFGEDGSKTKDSEFGGHGDQFTHLAYGNNMFVGIVAIHAAGGDGIGASFMDPAGTHLIDTMPLEMAESPGWAAYDW